MDEARTPTERLERDLRLTVDRLRSMGLPRLGASFEPEPTRADAAHAVAQRLADLAAELEGQPRRTVPRLADAAAGDQVAVCGHDLIAAAAACPPGEEIDALLSGAAALLLDLRRRV